jgi:uncharacterized phage-like protein YoqJ
MLSFTVLHARVREFAAGRAVVAGTGHRPEKLGGFGAEINRTLHALATRWLSEEHPGVVISGMAQGWDQALAHAAIDLGIPLVAAIPFKGQEAIWPLAAQRRYQAILRRAREIVAVSEGGYSARAMQARNELMVDLCDSLVALWDGSSGAAPRTAFATRRTGRGRSSRMSTCGTGYSPSAGSPELPGHFSERYWATGTLAVMLSASLLP